MEVDEDLFVVIVGEETDEERYSELHTKINEEEREAIGFKEIIETVEKHGEVLPFEFHIKEEPFEDLEEELFEYSLSKDIVDDHNSEIQQNQRHTMIKPNQHCSFISELRENFVELREDMDLLMDKLCEIMRSVKPPPPPQDYFIMNDIMFDAPGQLSKRAIASLINEQVAAIYDRILSEIEGDEVVLCTSALIPSQSKAAPPYTPCTTCGAMRDTIPGAARHYQEKHGARYLTCYACGVDFRSTTTLYKHEKRCAAPDAAVVLKARALFLGRKGRSRPYLTETMQKYVESENKMYPCQLCPAVFANNTSLQSHMHLHNGMRPYQCRQCLAAYTSQSALSRHKQKHLGVEYTCDHCKRSFKVKQALVAHMDTPLRKYPCEFCNRRFAQKMALKLHIDGTHYNLPPPCACHLCPKRYPKMSVLKVHMKKAHGMTLITRNMFFKRLPTLTETEFKLAKNLPAMTFIVPESDDLKYNYNAQEDFDVDLELKVTNNEPEEDKARQSKAAKLVIIQNGEIISSDCVQIKEELFLNDRGMEPEMGLVEEFHYDDNSDYSNINNLNADMVVNNEDNVHKYCNNI